MAYSTRIIEIASLVSKRRVADIGCDHGYLITYLLENNFVDFAVGADVNEGPLLNAKKNITSKGLNDRVELYISNGLEKLDENDFDTLVVAGMGGALIKTIIEQGFDKLSNKEIIVQPNNNSKVIRKFLQNNGYKVEFEGLIEENNVIYEILKFIPGAQNWTELEIEFGKFNLENKSELFKKLYTEKLESLELHYQKATNKLNETKLKDKIDLIKRAIS